MAKIKILFLRVMTVLYLKTVNFLERCKIITYIDTLTSELEVLKLEAANIVFSTWDQDEDLESEELEEKLNQLREKMKLLKEQEKQLEALAQRENEILGVQKSNKSTNENDIEKKQ